MPPTPISIRARASVKAERDRDVAALHAMQASRPKCPPPYNFGERRPNVARIEARKDRERGIA